MRTKTPKPAKKSATRKAAPSEVRIDGIAVSAGISIGRAYMVEAGVRQVPEYKLRQSQVDGEVARFRASVIDAQKQISKLKRKVDGLPSSAEEELSLLLEAHGAMLQSSRLTSGVEARITGQRQNAEAAVQDWVREVARAFEAMDDQYLAARVQDVRDVGNRILRLLTDTPYEAFSNLPAGSVIIAEDLSPADTALIDPDRIVGFATALGGPDGHTAIMARSMGLPAVQGAPGLLAAALANQPVIVDGEAGRVIFNPDPATLKEYRRKAEARRRLERQLDRLRQLPALTRDEVTIRLQANIELPRDLDNAQAAGAEGVGLLRTEFLFMNRDDLPDEEEQYAMLRTIVEGMDGNPVTIRTLDLGGEKLASSLGDRFADSPNPALGLRAIRLSLKEPKLLEVQLAAILRAGAFGPVRILLPMISTVSQIRQVRKIMAKVVKRLRRRKIKIASPLPPLGVMIEIPAAALAADAMARDADFFAIGTNDLTMYTLAIDRGDEQVAFLYNPLHPAVLRLIQMSVSAAQRNDIPISICGEIAGDPRYGPLLVGLGVRELSMAAKSLPRVKQRIRAISASTAGRRALAILDQWDEGRISALLDDFNEGL